MAHTFRLTDGSGTVNFTNWADYAPKSPDLAAVDYDPAGMYDGGERPLVTRQNVTENCRIWVDDTSTNAIRTTLRSVELLFSKAQHYQRTKMGVPVYVELDPDTSGTVYRSEVLSGVVQVDQDALKVGQWTGKRIGADITWTRRYYWEGPETALTLANIHGTATAGTVYPHNDAAHANYVQIAGTAVDGVIPAPIKLTLTNAGTVDLYDVYVGHNAWSSPATLGCTLECEYSADSGSGTAVDGNFSNGMYLSVGCGTAWKDMFWTLTAGTLNAFAGNWVVPLVRYYDASGTLDLAMYPKLQMADSALTTFTYYTGAELTNEQTTTYKVAQLNAFRLPAWLPGTSGYQSGRFYVYYHAVAGSATILFDNVTLMPADSYRVLSPIASSFGTSTMTVDDMIAGRIYNADSPGGTANLTAHIIGLGGPLELWPGKDQRLYFNTQGYNAVSPLGVSVSYRPRRLTL